MSEDEQDEKIEIIIQLPQRVFKRMRVGALRKYMRDCRISDAGSKKDCLKRIQYYRDRTRKRKRKDEQQPQDCIGKGFGINEPLKKKQKIDTFLKVATDQKEQEVKIQPISFKVAVSLSKQELVKQMEIRKMKPLRGKSISNLLVRVVFEWNTHPHD